MPGSATDNAIEPKTQIGDHVLSEGQTMALRVAANTFLEQLSDETFREDLGPIADAYQARLREVLLIFSQQAHR